MPENWKKALIILIHKKSNETKCGNYRRISLLDSEYKVFFLSSTEPYDPPDRRKPG